MKRTFTLLTLILIATAVMAQMPTFRTGKFNKAVSYIEAGAANIVAYDNNEIVVATNSVRSALGMKMAIGVQVMVMDTNLNVLRQVNITNTGYLDDALYANKVDGHLYILIRNRVFHNYRRAEVDLQTMSVVKVEDIIINFATNSQAPAIAINNSDRKGDKNGRTLSWYGKSDNNDFYGIVSVAINTVTNETNQTQFLLDNKFRPLWTKHYDVKTIDDMMIDDNGVMYLLGTTYNTDKQKSLVCFSRLDVDEEQTIEEEYRDGMISSLNIINAQNGMVIAAGPVIQEIKHDDRFYGKMIAMAINTHDRTVKTTTRDLTIEEMSAFNNDDYTKHSKAEYPEFVRVTQCLKTENGGIALFQKSWNIYYFGGSSPDYYQRSICGTLLMSVDSLGNIGWTKLFRSNYFEKTTFCEDQTLVSDLMLMKQNGNIYLMQQEVSSTPTTYPDNKKLNNLFNFMKHSLGVYCITPDGQVTKSVVKGAEAGSITGPFFPLTDNRYFTFFVSPKKTAPVYVNF